MTQSAVITDMRLFALLVGLTIVAGAVLLPQPGRALAYTANVKAGSQLNVRSGPGTDNPVVASVGDEQVITVGCQVWGEQISGTQRTTPYWNRIGDGQYISDAYLVWNPARPEIAWCGRNSGQPAAASVATDTLNVRSGPGTGNGVITQLTAGAGLSVRCQAWGTRIENTGSWLQIGD